MELKNAGTGEAGAMMTRKMSCDATRQISRDAGHSPSAAVAIREDLDPESGVTLKRTLAWDGVRVEHCQTCSVSAEMRHPEHRVSVPLSGSWTTELRSPVRPHFMKPKATGEIVIIPAEHRYTVRNTGPSECISILLAPAYLAGAVDDAPRSERTELLGSVSVRDPLVRQIALALVAEAALDGAADLSYMDSLVAALAAHLVRRYSPEGLGTSVSIGGLARPKLRVVEEFVAANYGREISLAQMAGVVGLSPFHFARAFKQSTGLTPHQYLVGVRIERARALLASSDLPIVDVCLSVGFKSQSSFTTRFRDHYSITPAAYRRAARH